MFLIQLFLTFSPISVSSPPASSFRSGARAQASITCQNRFSSRGEPKRMLSLSVAFWIQACCGTKAREPWENPDQQSHTELPNSDPLVLQADSRG